MKIKIDNGIAKVYTPYNPAFVKQVKQFGGAKWNGEGKCWQVPEDAVDAVRAIMEDIYGYSDISANETVKVKITVNEELSAWHGDVVVFGKVLSHASGRDSGARVGEDVSYIKGGVASGGSVKNWSSVVEEGSVIVLSNVNKNVFEKEKLNYNITVELMEDTATRSSLLEEKERLLKRIAEIDKILDNND